MVLKKTRNYTFMQVKLIIALLTFSITLITSTTTQAYALNNPFQTGDVFAAVGSGQVQRYNSAGVLQETITCPGGGFTTGMGFDASGDLYVTMFSADNICKVLKADSSSSTWASVAGGNHPESILFDTSGIAYVGNADGNRDIYKFNSLGVLQTQYNVATQSRGSDWIDLAADQCTMYYTSEGTLVKRFDVCTNTQLADFAILASSPAFALRLLPSGGLLVADSVNIKRLDATGATIQSYDVAGHDDWFSLNLDSDGTSFWAGDFTTGQIHKFDITAGGAPLQSIITGSSSLFGVTVFGEITVGGPGGGVIGGEILPIDNAALMLAGLQLSSMWMAPLVAGAAGSAIFYLKTRKN